MTKAALCVVTCSIIIIALFVVFCFLMSTVNPPPLVIVDKFDEETTEEYTETNVRFHIIYII